MKGSIAETGLATADKARWGAGEDSVHCHRISVERYRIYTNFTHEMTGADAFCRAPVLYSRFPKYVQKGTTT
ncbi:MAG: hypothetical protein J6D87_06745 [Clostridia bacterium]|nr:hypothetical protein [Clostridia bacterium]